MRSGRTRWVQPWSFFRPSTTTVALPAPWTHAPMALRKSCSSMISGSRAALDMTVVPEAAQAARMAFSVAPTLGVRRNISAPCRTAPRHRRRPLFSSISAPMARSAYRCRSIGRGPRSQPPGCEHTASPQRPKIAPKNITDERMRPISSSGISQPVIWRVSTTKSGPSR